MNPNAIPIVEKNLDKINWEMLSMNPNAIPILEKNLDKINWNYLSMNPNAIHILEKNLDKINWWNLSINPNAIHLLEQNPDKIDWWNLSTNPNAIHLLEQNPDKIDWRYLSMNPNAIHLLYKLDKNAMRQKNYTPANELVSTVMNPKRMKRMANKHGLDELEYGDYFNDVPIDPEPKDEESIREKQLKIDRIKREYDEDEWEDALKGDRMEKWFKKGFY
jgi:hypothetical protein